MIVVFTGSVHLLIKVISQKGVYQYIIYYHFEKHRKQNNLLFRQVFSIILSGK